MSFDVNIGRPQPVIKAAANMNNDGGSGGNTGYMMRERKKRDNNPFANIFDEEDPDIDSFEFGSKLKKQKAIEEAMGLKPSWIENFLDKLKK